MKGGGGGKKKQEINNNKYYQLHLVNQSFLLLDCKFHFLIQPPPPLSSSLSVCTMKSVGFWIVERKKEKKESLREEQDLRVGHIFFDSSAKRALQFMPQHPPPKKNSK